MRIRKLQQVFSRKGVIYTQVDEYDNCYIYQLNNGYYEVFKKRLSDPHPDYDYDYDKVECYPTDDAFGTWAWCYPNYWMAQRKAESLY